MSRKLCALALCALLPAPVPGVLDRLPTIFANVTAVWFEARQSTFPPQLNYQDVSNSDRMARLITDLMNILVAFSGIVTVCKVEFYIRSGSYVFIRLSLQQGDA
jgi:hypothetical protein